MKKNDQTDPIFAAIERYERAFAAVNADRAATCPPRLIHRQCRLAESLVKAPTTLGGLLKMLDYVRQDERVSGMSVVEQDGLFDDLLDTVERCVRYGFQLPHRKGKARPATRRMAGADRSSP
jgi:hypothetical protein